MVIKDPFADALKRNVERVKRSRSVDPEVKKCFLDMFDAKEKDEE